MKQLDLKNFDTSKIKSMSPPSKCYSLLDVGDITFGESEFSSFWECKNQELLKLPDDFEFDLSDIGNIVDMFLPCESLTTIDLKNFDSSNVMTMERKPPESLMTLSDEEINIFFNIKIK